MNMEIPDIRAELADEFETANKSTGPRTAEGKQRSSQNARKHGFYGKHFYWEAMVALGENPREFRRLLRGLVAARHPGDAFELALVEDIAMLYWKKQHLLLMDLQEHRIRYGAPPPASDPRPTPARDPAPQRDTALSQKGRVGHDGVFSSRRGSGEGSLRCHAHPAQNTENSGNELHDLLQSKALTTNAPSKRTGPFAQNEPQSDGNQTRDPALSRGERVARDGAFTSHRGSGEGSLHCHTHPAQHTENSRNELHDLLQSKALNTDAPSKRTVPQASNELLGGVNEWAGPARPIHEPTPHPSCSGWRKRRSPTPSPHGRGLLHRVAGMPATTSVAPIPPLRDRHAGLKPGATFAAGRVRGHVIAAPTQHNTQKIVGTNSTIYCSQKA